MEMKSLCVLGLVTVASAGPCLVLTDEPVFAQNYTKFLSVVTGNCDSVSVKSVADNAVHLAEFGEYIYSDVVLALKSPESFKFTSPDDLQLLPEAIKYRASADEVKAAKFSELKRGGTPGLCLSELVNFFEAGRNIFIAAQGGSGMSSDYRSLLAEFGMNMAASHVIADKSTKRVVSQYTGEKEPWTKIVSGNVAVAISGSPVLTAKNNDNVIALLRASSTASHPKTSVQGSKLAFAAANQGINGARATVVGSLSVFADAAMKGDDNAVWTRNLVSWAFGKRALLRARDLYHHKVGETSKPRMYKESDHIEFGITIEELKNGTWVPFAADDIRLEFVMLDPYIRQPLQFTGKQHRLVFRAPDKYGIFKFRIDYSRKGYNPIRVEEVAPVRNPRHNDYERFLFCAYPYYVSCFVSLVLVMAFSAFFINHRDGAVSNPQKESRHKE